MHFNYTAESEQTDNIKQSSVDFSFTDVIHSSSIAPVEEQHTVP